MESKRSETKGNLKITEAHYQILRAACGQVLADHSGVRESYQAAGHSAMRLNWDILRAAKIGNDNGIAWICSNLYSYLDDTHIGSALARIMGNGGMNQKGTRS